MAGKIFPFIPPLLYLFWIILALVAVLLDLAGFFVYYSARNVKFEVTDPRFAYKRGIYGRFVSKDSIIKENARISNLNVEKKYQPRIGTNGTGLPGYSEGWFKLKNGERALLFVTDRSRVVYMSTKEDFSVLLSTSQPEELLKSMGHLCNAVQRIIQKRIGRPCRH